NVAQYNKNEITFNMYMRIKKQKSAHIVEQRGTGFNNKGK
ncbi:2899_t:CDS:2, partial [Scutellospora calospora]